MIISPSCSPIFNNNPGYSYLEMDESTGEVTEIKWRYLQLYMYIFMKLKSYSEVDPEDLLKIDVNDVTSIRELNNRISGDANLFG